MGATAAAPRPTSVITAAAIGNCRGWFGVLCDGCFAEMLTEVFCPAAARPFRG